QLTEEGERIVAEVTSGSEGYITSSTAAVIGKKFEQSDSGIESKSFLKEEAGEEGMKVQKLLEDDETMKSKEGSAIIQGNTDSGSINQTQEAQIQVSPSSS
ncbi:4789_t:CDS:2, partial [Funneliformis geosporum]